MVTERAVRHPVFARFYARVCPEMERIGMAAHRQELVDGLRGEVIEVGAGTGANFAHYPEAVTRLVAVEPEPYLRNLATEQAQRVSIDVEVVDGTAERLPVGAGMFDAAVVSLVLCSVADPAAAVAELVRVIRPGGQVRFLEHVRADTPGLARVQRLLDATVWPKLTGGCHASRDPVGLFTAAGFEVSRCSRLRFPDRRVPAPTAPHVLGVAVRHGDGT